MARAERIEDLITLQGIAIRAELGMDRMYQLVSTKGFPEPARVLGTIKLYRAGDVEAWIAQRKRSKAARK